MADRDTIETNAVSTTTSDKRSACVECSRLYGHAPTYDVHVQTPASEPQPRYSGPDRLFATRSHIVNDLRFTHWVLWDCSAWGVTYQPFCSPGCTLAYARKAHARRFGRHLRLIK